MQEFRQPAFRMHQAHPLPIRKVNRPFALRPDLGSFHTYDALIKHIMKKASGMGLAPQKLSHFEQHLKDISASTERLKMMGVDGGRPGNKKAVLCIVAEIAFCCRDPAHAIKSLRNSYALIVRMADNVRNGRPKPVPEHLEKRVAECEATAKLLCSVSGLRQIRREAASSGQLQGSTYRLPEVSDAAMIGYVNVSPSLQNGQGVDSRRPIPINPAKGEARGDYSKTIALILERLVSCGSAERFNGTWIRVAFEEIAESISALPFEGNKRRILCLIAETCILYKDAAGVLDGFRESYSVLKKISETVEKGKTYPIRPGQEKRAEDFARRVRMFASLSAMTTIRAYAALSTNGSGSTYEIGFVNHQELREIAYGKGREPEFH
ncbi:MAG: hypothetical protein NTY83_02325 [Candidatus Micrarchaeota archaeon]|nr:hypothetical protein [Candidatus Micrarchaeota archaeon]